MLDNIIKTEHFLSDNLPESKKSQLQQECLNARHHLFYNRIVNNNRKVNHLIINKYTTKNLFYMGATFLI